MENRPGTLENLGLMKPRILIHPDIFYSGHSGAIAAREAARQLANLGYDIGIFTHDEEDKNLGDYHYFQRIPYTGKANYFNSAYKKSFTRILEQFRPDYLFFIGGIVNTPVVYLDLCRRYGVKTVFLLLVQDFFCARLHAGLNESSCTLCLDGSNWNALSNRCGDKQARPSLFLLNYQAVQKMFLSRMRKLDYVLGSSDEQLNFYRQVGVDSSKIVKIPLFFDQNRIRTPELTSAPYFVIIGQYRHEKGIHLISKILDHIREGITVKLLFFNQAETDKFLREYPENRQHCDSGKLEILPGVTMTTGAVELIARSGGVINPSIWATTTEFVLLEVLGLSKPVITFDVGIHREVIQNRINGICVKAGDFSGMGAEINYLADHPELGAKIAPEALKLFHRLTDESSFSPVLSEIFR